MTRDETIEKLAEYAHEAWAGWIRYMFSKGTIYPDGSLTLPDWAVERWLRQAETPYGELPEEEKKSDREEAIKMIGICGGLL